MGGQRFPCVGIYNNCFAQSFIFCVYSSLSLVFRILCLRLATIGLAAQSLFSPPVFTAAAPPPRPSLALCAVCNIADFCVMQCMKGFVEVMVDLQKDDQSVTQALSPDGPPPISTSNLIFLPRFPSVPIHLLMEGHLLHPPTISWIQPKPTSFFVMVFVLGLTRSYQSSLCSLQGQDGEKLFSVLPRIQRHQQPHFVFNFPTQSR